MKKRPNINLTSPLLYIILGALLVIFNAQLLNWAMTIAGIFFVVMGVLDLLKGRTGSGIVNLAIGIIIIILGWTIFDIVLKVLGVLIAAKGIFDLISVLKIKKANALSVIVAALTIAIGITLAVSTGNVLGVVMKICGALLIIDGVLGLLGAKKMR